MPREARNTVFADRLVLWMPRLLGIAFALFLSIFAFGAFSDSGTPFDKAVAFLIHLIPAGSSASWSSSPGGVSF